MFIAAGVAGMLIFLWPTLCSVIGNPQFEAGLSVFLIIALVRIPAMLFGMPDLWLIFIEKNVCVVYAYISAMLIGAPVAVLLYRAWSIYGFAIGISCGLATWYAILGYFCALYGIRTGWATLLSGARK
jgi:hypothetical protein